MIFAELEYESNYEDVHQDLVALLSDNFLHVESGHQGDSYIWILDGSEKVTIDTFSSMKHQVKSGRPGPHVQRVIDVLLLKYKLNIYKTPEPEPHEDTV